jgi:hypothetical protein
MNLTFKKYSEWLAARGQIWPVQFRPMPLLFATQPPVSKVTTVQIGKVTLLHDLQEALTSEQVILMERIAAACKGCDITIAFGKNAAGNLSEAGEGARYAPIIAPSLDSLACDQSAKRVLWQEIKKRGSATANPNASDGAQ